MAIQDAHGNKLVRVIPMDEEGLHLLDPLTHAVVIARNAGNVLLVFNRLKAHWELPGGTIDRGETPRFCAVRELHEESGLRCDGAALRFAGAIETVVGTGPDQHVEYGALYHVKIDRVDPFAPNDEIAARRWWDGSSLEHLSPIDRALALVV